MAGRPKTPSQQPPKQSNRKQIRLASIGTLVPEHEGCKLTFSEILNQLWTLALKAEKSGSYMASIRATELIGKHMGMFIERSVSISATTDLRSISEEQLDQVITEAKRRNLLPAGDVIDAEIISQDLLEIQHAGPVESSDCKNDASTAESSA